MIGGLDRATAGTVEVEGRDLLLVDAGAFKPLCGPVAVPNHRAIPRLAFGLEVKPTRIVSATEQGIPRRGYFVDPASPFVIHNFILDPTPPPRFSLKVIPPGYRLVAGRSGVAFREPRGARVWKISRPCAAPPTGAA